MIALNGLLPSICNAVLQKGSKTLDELLQTATLFEVATGTDPTGQGEILKAISAMQLQLERLSGPSVSPPRSRLGNRKVSFDLPSDSTPQENDEEPSLSPTYDFVSHSGTQSDNQSQPSATHHRSRSLDRSFRSAPPSFRTAPPLFQSVSSSPQYPPPPFRSGNPRPNQRPPNAQFTTPWPNGTSYSNPSSATRNPRTCGNCGRSHLNGRCAAWGQQCHSCSRFNHFSRVCMASRRANPEDIRPTLVQQGGPTSNHSDSFQRRSHYVSSHFDSPTPPFIQRELRFHQRSLHLSVIP